MNNPFANVDWNGVRNQLSQINAFKNPALQKNDSYLVGLDNDSGIVKDNYGSALRNTNARGLFEGTQYDTTPGFISQNKTENDFSRFFQKRDPSGYSKGAEDNMRIKAISNKLFGNR